MSLPFETAVRVTGARVLEFGHMPGELRVVSDTRSLRRGDTFLALHGERFDGNDFVERAIAAGAVAVIADRAPAREFGVPVLLVDNALTALMALAAAARERLSARVAAITGSNGKTTTKELLRQLLETRYQRVLCTPANENNEIGVSKLLLAASEGVYDAVVIEMGARHEGDIAPLVAISRPQVGVLTNIGEAHLEIMGSRERLEETKWALFSSGARAVLNLSDETSRRRASSLEQLPYWFFAGDEVPRMTRGMKLCAIVGHDRLVIFEENGKRAERRIDLRLPGLYNRANLAAALAAALDLDVQIDAAIAAFPALTLPGGRFERVKLNAGPQLIYDAYNANVSGTIAALDAFAEEPAHRRIAVLGSMAELGEEAEAMHEQVGAHAAERVDLLLVGGEFAAAIARGASRAGLPQREIVAFSTNHEAASWLREHAKHDDLVLLKGSRKYRLEEILEELRQ